MTLPGWGQKVLLLAIIPVPHHTNVSMRFYTVSMHKILAERVLFQYNFDRVTTLIVLYSCEGVKWQYITDTPSSLSILLSIFKCQMCVNHFFCKMPGVA